MFSLESWDCQSADKKEKNSNFLDEYSCSGAVFSIETSMEEIELVVAENWKFEYRAKSKEIALFWNIWTITNPMHVLKQKKH